MTVPRASRDNDSRALIAICFALTEQRELCSALFNSDLDLRIERSNKHVIDERPRIVL